MAGVNGTTRRRAVLTALTVAALLALFWAFGAFLPSWINWEEKSFDAGQGQTAFHVTLQEKRLTVSRGGERLFSSPLLWRVSDVFAGDLNGDGQQELTAIVYKHGSYGQARPFWDTHNSPAFCPHVFIYTLDADKGPVPLWMSSDTGRPIASAQMDETQRLHLFEPSGEETVWFWDGWGLTLCENGAADSASDEASGGTAGRLTLLAVGDNLAHESVCRACYDASSKTFDFTPLYKEISGTVSSCDLAVVGQETILVQDPARRSDFPNFATPDTMGDALVKAGFDVVLGANNHAFDKGSDGINETLSFWSESHPEITLLGLHKSADDYDAIDYVEKNGIRLALFNYTEQLNGHDLPENEPWRVNTLSPNGRRKLLTDLETAEKQADLSVCFLHAGEEYAHKTAPALRRLCEDLIDAGADVIICAHPHVLQPVREVKTARGARGIVYYSLGNFMSHQRRADTVLGGAAYITIEKGHGTAVTDYRLIGTVCHVEPGLTRVYLLDDYTQELAAKHFINEEKTQFTLESLNKDLSDAAGQ